MRASNTTPVIVLRFEAETEQGLLEIQDDFREKLKTKINVSDIPF